MLNCVFTQLSEVMMPNRNSQSGSKRGFASMDESKQKEISSKGGKAAHEKGSAHEFNSKEAREAGSRGGRNSGGGSKSR
jgi:general stress protein YciG